MRLSTVSPANIYTISDSSTLYGNREMWSHSWSAYISSDLCSPKIEFALGQHSNYMQSVLQRLPIFPRRASRDFLSLLACSDRRSIPRAKDKRSMLIPASHGKSAKVTWKVLSSLCPGFVHSAQHISRSLSFRLSRKRRRRRRTRLDKSNIVGLK